MDTKKKTSFIFTGEAKRLLEDMARTYGMSQTTMLELILRDRARQEGLWR